MISGKRHGRLVVTLEKTGGGRLHGGAALRFYIHLSARSTSGSTYRMHAKLITATGKLHSACNIDLFINLLLYFPLGKGFLCFLRLESRKRCSSSSCSS